MGPWGSVGLGRDAHRPTSHGEACGFCPGAMPARRGWGRRRAHPGTGAPPPRPPALPWAALPPQHRWPGSCRGDLPGSTGCVCGTPYLCAGVPHAPGGPGVTTDSGRQKTGLQSGLWSAPRAPERGRWFWSQRPGFQRLLVSLSPTLPQSSVRDSSEGTATGFSVSAAGVSLSILRAQFPPSLARGCVWLCSQQCSGKAHLLPLLLPTRLVAIVRTLGLSGPLFLGLKHEGRVLSTRTPFQPFLVSVRLLRCKDHSLLFSTSVVGGQVCTPVHPSRLTSVSAGGTGGAEE